MSITRSPLPCVVAPSLNPHCVAWIVCDAALYGERGGEVVPLSDHVPCRIRWRPIVNGHGEMVLDRTISVQAKYAGRKGRIRISLPRKRQHYFDHFFTPTPMPGETAILRPMQ